MSSRDTSLKTPKVTVILLNWNGQEDTCACLESLAGVRYDNLAIVVVDNGSKDGSVMVIQDRFPNVRLIAHPVNTGFAEGNNIGIRQVIQKTDYVLLLNNDTLVSADLVERLILYMEAEPTTAVVGPAICYCQEPDRVWCAGLAIGAGRMFGVPIRNTTSVLMYCGGTVDDLPEQPYSVDAVVGCAMLLRATVVREIGLLDSNLFMIHEDFDWSLRAQARGYRCVIVPFVGVWHKVSSSIKQQDQYRRGGAAAAYYWYRNWLVVVRRHFGLRSMLIVVALYLFRLFPSLVWHDLAQKRIMPSLWTAYGVSVIDALLGRYKRRFVR